MWVRSIEAKRNEQWYAKWIPTYWHLRDSVCARVLEGTNGVYVHRLCWRNRKCSAWHDCETGMPK